MATFAEKSELDSMMLGFLPYLRITKQEAFKYVEMVCLSKTLPVMLYNNPPRTGFDLHTETLIKLVEKFPQIAALKEAGDPDTVLIVKRRLGK